MLKLGIRKKKQIVDLKPDDATMQGVFDAIDRYNTALSSNAILRLVGIDTSELDECLQLLVNKKWIEVAYEKTGLDGITRAYYRVSENYNLLDAKSKISKFITDVIRKAKPVVDNGKHYSVRVPRRREFNMVFDTRQHARDYRNLLKESRMHLSSDVWEEVFEEGLQVKEKRIS